MKVLLVGGTGVLSADIRDLALKKGYEVYIVNRGHSKESLDDRVKLIIADIRDVQQVKKKIEGLYFDVVIDFLSFSPKQLKNTLSIFDGKCNQYMFISSATVYRKTSPEEYITEDIELNNDEWDYAQKKIECEKLLEQNYKENKQQYTIIRPYVTYSRTRIPFAIIPHDKQWSLANRILLGKPVVLWDNGQANCTLTNTKDFAVGIVGLFNNEKAYQQAFHLTTDTVMNWYEAVQDLAKVLNKEAVIADIPSNYIIKRQPELKGVLLGDKGIDRKFDNSKIKAAVPEFNCKIGFKEGIKETVDYYLSRKYMRSIDYEWDARMDKLIEEYYKKIDKNDYDKRIITNYYHLKEQTFKEKIIYHISRNDITYAIYKKIKTVCHYIKRAYQKTVMRILSRLKIKGKNESKKRVN